MSATDFLFSVLMAFGVPIFFVLVVFLAWFLIKHTTPPGTDDISHKVPEEKPRDEPPP